eukprot:358066-Chlamydomonas_euryale.AAC.8
MPSQPAARHINHAIHRQPVARHVNDAMPRQPVARHVNHVMLSHAMPWRARLRHATLPHAVSSTQCHATPCDYMQCHALPSKHLLAMPCNTPKSVPCIYMR